MTQPQRVALRQLADGQLHRTQMTSYASSIAMNTAKFLLRHGLASRHYIRRSDGAEITAEEVDNMVPLTWAIALRITDLGRQMLAQIDQEKK